MSFYSFKPNPKQLVLNKAKHLFGNDTKVMVTGERLSPIECKRHGIPTGTYYVECIINSESIVTAHANDWRKAYKLLLIEVEKAFERRLYVTEGV